MPRKTSPCKSVGFTLIELLVVIAIIAILAAILFPVFLTAKSSAQSSRCVSNLRQINTALITYVDTWNGFLPGGKPDAATGYYLEPYHCRIADASWTGNSWGFTSNRRYMQDFLAPFIKSADVWICPSINQNSKFPGTNYRWSQNTGSGKDAAGNNCNTWVRKAPTNYAWTFMYLGRSGNQAQNKYASGASTSKISRPSKAMMFLEMPWWSLNDMPHKSGNSEGVNLSFYDGHVKFTRPPADKDGSYTSGWGAYAQYGWSDSWR
ncbi:MAG: prepilin-type N-terminal cleavage/methylation domain-containing protein [Armatimonadota bacterium]|nr:prepilin-type N-terminal cleavage/methylation domain-containing protein [bacterium]